MKYSTLDSGEDVVRFKWYQEGVGGAFYLKMYEDDGGMPGSETYSRVMAGSLVDGWNEFDLSDQGLVVSGDFGLELKSLVQLNLLVSTLALIQEIQWQQQQVLGVLLMVI